MLSLLGFLAILCPLVIVHEFGHFLFAKIFNVKAEVFSIGFGPSLFKKKWGETEWRVSVIPLGGYVKLLGEDPTVELSIEDQKRALGRQVPWKRFFIFFGGPLFNFLFAILVFMAILVLGEPQIASVVGRVVKNSYAEKVGFKSGDRIVEINGHSVKKYEDILLAVNESPNKPLDLKIKRKELYLNLLVTPAPQKGFSVYGEATDVGEIQGMLPSARATQAGISNPHSLAAMAGIKTGDKIILVAGTPVLTWEEVEDTYQKINSGAQFVLKIQPQKGGTPNGASKEISLKKSLVSLGIEKDLGLYSSELFVEKTIPKSPAEQTGILAGDHLLKVGENEVYSFFDLKNAVQRSGEKDGKVIVEWEHAGQLKSAAITPTATNARDVLLRKTTQYTIGVMPMLFWAEPSTITERVLNPFMLLYKATERTVVFSWRNIVSIRKMITGDVSVTTLGGPILIGKIAGESLARGLIAFLTTMAILSVGLGILNVLPIPVLDGGHLLLLGIEAVRGRPLSIRQTEIIQQVGLSLILLLMVVVIRNDLARLPFFD